MQASILDEFSAGLRKTGFPRRDTKTLFPFTLKKRSRVAAPGRTVSHSSRARPLFPPLSVPNWKQTGLGDGGAFAPPKSFEQESQDSPIRWSQNGGRGAFAPYLKPEGQGLILARNGASLYGPSALIKVVPPSPAASTLTILAGPGNLRLGFRAGNTAKNRREAAGGRMMTTTGCAFRQTGRWWRRFGLPIYLRY
jgi:hypothetical protein